MLRPLGDCPNVSVLEIVSTIKDLLVKQVYAEYDGFAIAYECDLITKFKQDTLTHPMDKYRWSSPNI